MGRRIAHAWGRRQLAGLWYSAIAVAALVVIVPLATCGGCVGSMSLGEVGFALKKGERIRPSQKRLLRKADERLFQLESKLPELCS